MATWQDRSFLLRAAALLVLLAGMALPPVTVARPVHTVLAVLDITLSMNVRDQSLDGAPASRIDMEKRAAASLLAQLSCGSRFALAIFVERQPFLLFEPVEVCEKLPRAGRGDRRGGLAHGVGLGKPHQRGPCSDQSGWPASWAPTWCS